MNSIVLGNAAQFGDEVVGNGTTLLLGTVITSGSAAAVFADLDTSGGGVLADNGGPVRTVALRTHPTNPALDAAVLDEDALLDITIPLTDARGVSAFDIFDFGNGGIRDLGALEVIEQAPVITSNGGGDTVRLEVPEGRSFVADIETSDENDSEGAGLNYALLGGADQAAFTLDPVTGALSFIVTPDFELPADANGDDVYEVSVQVTDSFGFSDSQAFAITVTDQAEVIVVDSALDKDDGDFSAGQLTLREAVRLANAQPGSEDTITFAPALIGTEIVFAGGPSAAAPLRIAGDVTIDGDIDGDGRADITVDALQSSGVLEISSGTVEIHALNIVGGRAVDARLGGGITVEEGAEVTISSTTISGNEHINQNGVAGGGGIRNRGMLELVDSTIAGNRAVSETGTARGGGFLNEGAGATLKLTNVTIAANAAISSSGSTGGGGFNDRGTVTLNNTTVTSNVAESVGGIASENAVSVQLNNSLLLGNQGDQAGGLNPAFELNSTITSADPDLVFAETAQLGTSGVFGGVLADNGGPVQTIALAPSSSNPAIDVATSGGNTGDTSATAADARGVEAIDIPGLGTVNRDLGAFEVPNTTPTFSFPTGSSATVDVDENTRLAIDLEAVDATDAEGAGLTFALLGGVDEDFFDLDPATGQLVFVAAPDFETPLDDGRDNGYEVSVRVSDTGGLTDIVALTIQLQDVEQRSLEVTTAQDVVDEADGLTSLREAVAFANSNPDNSRITFSGTLAGQTIALTAGQLTLSTEITIDGDSNRDGIRDITVSGSNTSRVFDIAASSITLDNLTLIDGNSGTQDGGGIRVVEDAMLVLRNSVVRSSQANDGAGVANFGTALLSNVTLAENEANRDGGGFFNAGVATLVNTTVAGNAVGGAGGGISNRAGSADISSSTVSGNFAVSPGGGVYSAAGANTSLTNSIVLGNAAEGQAEIAGTLGQFGANVSGGIDASAVFSDTVEVLDIYARGTGVYAGLLADNGGPVPTLALASDADNPALDASAGDEIHVADARGVSAFDQIGIGSEAGPAVRDLGAFELAEQVDVAPPAPPDASNDIATVIQGGSALIDVLSNDNASAGDLLTISSVTSGTNGETAIELGAVRYIPNPGYAGPDSFTYTVTDGTLTATAIVSVTVEFAVGQNAILGTEDIDVLRGTTEADVFRSLGGAVDVLDLAAGGADIIEFGAETDNGRREFEYVLGFGSDDGFNLGGRSIVQEANLPGKTLLFLEGDGDVIVLFDVTGFDDSQIIG